MISINIWVTSLPFLPMLITKGSPPDSKLLPTGALTHLPFSLHLPLSLLLLSFSLYFSGTTHSISDLGGLWMWLSGFPRAALSRPNSLSPPRSTSTWIWCWAGGRGGRGGGRVGGVGSCPGKHHSLDDYLQSPPGSLYVGECLLNTGCAYCRAEQLKSRRCAGSTQLVKLLYFSWLSFGHSLKWPCFCQVKTSDLPNDSLGFRLTRTHFNFI